MIIQKPYKYTPGLSRLCGNPEPLAPVQTYDTPEHIERCLTCPIPPDACHGQCEDTQFAYSGCGRPSKVPTERFVQMVRDGWTKTAICRELGIHPNTYTNKIKYCRAKGLLTSPRRRR